MGICTGYIYILVVFLAIEKGSVNYSLAANQFRSFYDENGIQRNVATETVIMNSKLNVTNREAYVLAL